MRAQAFGVESLLWWSRRAAPYTASRQRLVDRARRGAGPAFLLWQHVPLSRTPCRDINREYYRSKQEEQTWKTQRDPILNLRNWLIEQKLADAIALDRWHDELESGNETGDGVGDRHALTRVPMKLEQTYMLETATDRELTFAQAIS